MPNIPKLTNRGPAGLLNKLPQRPPGQDARTNGVAKPQNQWRIDYIIEALQPMCVPIDTLKLDPDNARVHPERNLQAIMESLSTYGQRHPVVVNRVTGFIQAGNGRWTAAKAMGWTKLAAVFVDDDLATAAGFGLADNRTAELAKWDFEVVAKLDRLIQDCGGGAMIGWTSDELDVLRVADWTPPPVDAGADDGVLNLTGATVHFTDEQWAEVSQAIEVIKGLLPDVSEVDLTSSYCLSVICAQWIGGGQ